MGRGDNDFDCRSKAIRVMRQHYAVGKPVTPEGLTALGRYILELESDVDDLTRELWVMVDHASEDYPHFESDRGLADIARANAVIIATRRVRG